MYLSIYLFIYVYRCITTYSIISIYRVCFFTIVKLLKLFKDIFNKMKKQIKHKTRTRVFQQQPPPSREIISADPLRPIPFLQRTCDSIHCPLPKRRNGAKPCKEDHLCLVRSVKTGKWPQEHLRGAPASARRQR